MLGIEYRVFNVELSGYSFCFFGFYKLEGELDIKEVNE